MPDTTTKQIIKNSTVSFGKQMHEGSKNRLHDLKIVAENVPIFQGQQGAYFLTGL